MENEKFQELVIEQLEKVVLKLEQHDQRFDTLEERIGDVENRLVKVEDRLINLEDLLKKHHEDTEKIELQVEQLVTDQDYFTNFLLKKRNFK